MVDILPPETLYRFIVADFEGAWNALASYSTPCGRGNFMFARQAMSLLEWAARLRVDSIVEGEWRLLVRGTRGKA